VSAELKKCLLGPSEAVRTELSSDRYTWTEMVSPVDYLKLPYTRMITPESDGSFRAEVLEFPGCVALASESIEALKKLEVVAADWIEAVEARGQLIPEPLASARYSGKLQIHMPKSLHRKAALLAEREGVSLNLFIIACVIGRLGMETGRP
jgi:predicted HicB family RNase H-like nuclease